MNVITAGCILPWLSAGPSTERIGAATEVSGPSTERIGAVFEAWSFGWTDRRGIR